jgi:uncharacterized protein YbbK (DUF523 family)
LIRILISACLAGEPVRYDGTSVRTGHPLLAMWHEQGRLMPLCPELAGGLAVPREPCEIVDTRVLTQSGADLTGEFERGATAALAEAQRHDVRMAILKSGSPSCGSGWVYDGTFSSTRRTGDGVTAARLIAAGIAVFTEQEIDAAATHLKTLEAQDPAAQPV